MEEVFNFLNYLKNEKHLSLPFASFFEDGSGYISYTDSYHEDVQLFSFNNFEELLEKIKYFDQN